MAVIMVLLVQRSPTAWFGRACRIKACGVRRIRASFGPTSARIGFTRYPFCVRHVRCAPESRCGSSSLCGTQLGAREVHVPILPRDVKKALELLRADPARARTIDVLAAECGVARRTLEKHFRRFLGRTPTETV